MIIPNKYDNAEEERVTTGSEQQTAKMMGEIKEGQVTRKDHSAKAIIITNDPMSNKGRFIPVKEYFKPPDPNIVIAKTGTKK